MPKTLNLESDEHIVQCSRISVVSLILYWVSVPSILSVWFFRLILPKIIKAEEVAEFLGENGSFLSSIGSFFNMLMLFIVIVLGTIWVIFCLVVTTRALTHQVTFTDRRILGQAGNESLIALLFEVKDVFVEQNLLGRLFHYGSLTVHTKRGSITLKNIADPQKFRDYFLNNPDIFTGGGMF